MTSGRQWLRVAGLRLPLPRLLVGGARTREWEEPDGRLGLQPDAASPRLRRLRRVRSRHEGGIGRAPTEVRSAEAPRTSAASAPYRGSEASRPYRASEARRGPLPPVRRERRPLRERSERPYRAERSQARPLPPVRRERRPLRERSERPYRAERSPGAAPTAGAKRAAPSEARSAEPPVASIVRDGYPRAAYRTALTTRTDGRSRSMWSRRRFLETVSAVPLVGGFIGARRRAGGGRGPKGPGLLPRAGRAPLHQRGRDLHGHDRLADAAGSDGGDQLRLQALRDARRAARPRRRAHRHAGALPRPRWSRPGAASALTLGTAAVLTGTDRQKIGDLPNLAGMKSEVIIQKSHRFGYEHAVRNCGVTAGGGRDARGSRARGQRQDRDDALLQQQQQAKGGFRTRSSSSSGRSTACRR